MERNVIVEEIPDPEKIKPLAANPKKGLAAWLMEVARETGPLMNDGRTLKEMMDELYDEETGLPK